MHFKYFIEIKCNGLFKILYIDLILIGVMLYNLKP